MHTVAVVEDNSELLTDLVEFLNLRGFHAVGFCSAENFFCAWGAQSFSLLLLDIVLPGADGFEIAQQVRAKDPCVGIVMLTALDANDDQVKGLGVGADIYLSKRSSLEVIEAACHSVLRRVQAASHSVIDHPELWALFAASWQLQAPNRVKVVLTHVETIVLAALFDAAGMSVSREALLQRLEKPETLSNLRNLDNVVSRLRKKVHAACKMELPVRSGYGKGYVFVGARVVSP